MQVTPKRAPKQNPRNCRGLLIAFGGDGLNYQNFHHGFLPFAAAFWPVAWPVTLSFRQPVVSQLDLRHK